LFFAVGVFPFLSIFEKVKAVIGKVDHLLDIFMRETKHLLASHAGGTNYRRRY